MTIQELARIDGFSEKERDAAGKLVNWPDYHFETMVWVARVREWVGSSCVLIRGDHNIGSSKAYSLDKRTAIDYFFPKAPFGRVAMEVIRLPCSWGLYAGKTVGSIHTDLRAPVNGRPARWLAFHPKYEPLLKGAGLGTMISGRADGWIYLKWSSHLGVKALYLMQQVLDDDPQGLLSPV